MNYEEMWEKSETALRKADNELESTYAHIRAVINNCLHVPVEAIRHQLVGLLPEVQTMEPETAREMRDKGLGHLVDREEELAWQAWAEYGYGENSGA